MRASTKAEAARSLTTHAFYPGRGYVDYGVAPSYPDQPLQATNACDPPAGTLNSSQHVLKAPTGPVSYPFTWVASERAWLRASGNRMAWAATYLAAHGWSYGYAL